MTSTLASALDTCQDRSMKKYFALYLMPIEEIQKMMATTNPEEMKAGMDAWRKWMDEHKHIFVDPGSPLGKTLRVTKDGISQVKNDITGYGIVEAESHEAAAKLFEGQPHLMMPGASMEIMEVTEMPNA